MAGRPLLRKTNTLISEKPGGEEWVYEQLAAGQTVGQVAESLGISRRFLYYWRDQEKERRKPLWQEAIRISAEVDADAVLEEYERLDRAIGVDEEGNTVHRIPHSAEVALATGRAKYRQWRASIKDPARFATKPDTQVNVQVNVGDAHLAALQRAKQLRPRDPQELVARDLAAPADEDDAPDYEIT